MPVELTLRLDQRVGSDQNYPNPFGVDGTTVVYTLINATEVKIEFFDRLGRTLSEVNVAHRQQGANTYHFPSRNVESGVYYVRVSSGTQSAVTKMITI